jgi:DNA invertase Pin-like site-specific DNA recombinase
MTGLSHNSYWRAIMTFQKNTTKRAAIYIRVSTDGQTVDNQRLELEEAAERAGWEIVGVYDDNGVSGAKSREEREAFDRLCKDAIRRKFDIVMSWSVDRLGRSLQDLVGFLSELHGVGCDLYLHQQGIDTTTPTGKMMFQMCGVFAEFERSMIQERVKAGLNRAKAQGKILGRPKVSGKVENAVLAARAGGTGKRKIARQLGIGVSTVNRILSEAA